jgi:hypothetical protein
LGPSVDLLLLSMSEASKSALIRSGQVGDWEFVYQAILDAVRRFDEYEVIRAAASVAGMAKDEAN